MIHHIPDSSPKYRGLLFENLSVKVKEVCSRYPRIVYAGVRPEWPAVHVIALDSFQGGLELGRVYEALTHWVDGLGADFDFSCGRKDLGDPLIEGGTWVKVYP